MAPIEQSNLTLSCGFPSPANDYKDKKLSLDNLLIKHEAATFMVEAIGKSMYPTIYEKDLLLVDRALTPKSGQIVVVHIHGEFTAKRYFPNSDKECFHSDNPEFPPVKVSKEDAEIWGVVSAIIRQNP